ncbi:DUF89 domain-containing protein [Candidatus Omnitrophota bacterium]
MQTSLDCVPCFLKQAQDAAKFAGASRTLQKQILQALARKIEKFDFRACPSEMGRELYALVIKKTGNKDPFKKIKQKSNRFALSLYPRLKKKVAGSKDKLLSAIELAIAGNIIDYGVKHLNIDREIARIFDQEEKTIRRERPELFCYPELKKAIRRAKTILYLADNAGEIVFDRVFIEQLKGKQVIFAVRGKPIINDALAEDAIFCGIDKIARVVSTGCDAPGAILKFCSRSFRQMFAQWPELIISKGQGNFEALANQGQEIFFLFRAKCPVVVKHLNCKMGDVILKKQN